MTSLILLFLVILLIASETRKVGEIKSQQIKFEDGTNYKVTAKDAIPIMGIIMYELPDIMKLYREQLYHEDTVKDKIEDFTFKEK